MAVSKKRVTRKTRNRKERGLPGDWRSMSAAEYDQASRNAASSGYGNQFRQTALKAKEIIEPGPASRLEQPWPAEATTTPSNRPSSEDPDVAHKQTPEEMFNSLPVAEVGMSAVDLMLTAPSSVAALFAAITMRNAIFEMGIVVGVEYGSHKVVLITPGHVYDLTFTEVPPPTASGQNPPVMVINHPQLRD